MNRRFFQLDLLALIGAIQERHDLARVQSALGLNVVLEVPFVTLFATAQLIASA